MEEKKEACITHESLQVNNQDQNDRMVNEIMSTIKIITQYKEKYKNIDKVYAYYRQHGTYKGVSEYLRQYL